MATLQQLGVSLGVGCGILSTTLFLFAGAIRLRITHIAPRCEARPRSVIYNTDRPNCDASQDRGNPFLLGWVFWALRLNYHTFLQGVPGTGTRDGGLSGHLLKTNLDMVVLLRFHALALKIATFAMIVYCAVALPVYMTARCYNAPYDETHTISNCTDDESYNLTRYERITLANIPALTEAKGWDTEHDMISFRLYIVVLCTYIVCWYTCYELQEEWIDLLAMRRVYYLEYDHWKGRREELNATMLTQQRNESRANGKSQWMDCRDPHLHQRESWIPHPELNDTPPNIGLYSVLVGGLPNRPRQAVLDEDVEAALTAAEANDDDDDDSQKLDWQLSVTAAFFDYCVPNQPGFSSSVAAVSILPSASELAQAWKKFYKATKRLSRLRFIRRQLLERGYQDNRDEDEGEYKYHGYNENSDDEDDDSYVVDSDEEIYVPAEKARARAHDVEGNNTHSEDPSTRRRKYADEILGSITDEDVETLFLQSLHMGPEQIAVYSREMARSVGNCCPHGCCEEEIRCASFEKLLKMEAHAKKAAKKAFSDLEEARRSAALAQEMRAEKQDLHRKASMLWFEESSLDLSTPSPARKKNSKTVESRIYQKGHTTLSSPTNQRASHKQQGGPFMNEPLQKDSGHSINTHQESLTPPSSGRNVNKSVEFKRRESDDSFKTAASNLEPSEHSKHVTAHLHGEIDDMPRAPPPLPKPRALHEEWDSTLKFSSWASSMVLTPDPVTPVTQNDISASSNPESKELDPWEIVELVATEAETSASRTGTLKRGHRVDDGAWQWPTIRLLRKRFKKKIRDILSWGMSTTDNVTDVQARDSTFAVVTFTSRQAAIAARNCLSDGRGAGRWRTLEEIPTPPLADASAFNICDCRGCMRPVTVTLNEQQKVTRNYLALGMVGLIYIFYTYPITWAATFGSENAVSIFGSHPAFTSDKLFGFIRAQLLNLFLAFCPDVFLAIANFGSNATSMVGAEFAALQYYWWFMVLFALLTSSFFQMMIRSADVNGSLEFLENFQKVAKTIPSEVSATWANWIILKCTIFHPLFYLLQLNSFIFSCLGLRCCARVMKGGGSGNRIPYRFYVESGVVLMCVLALAPAAPIVAPFAVLYFFICTPLLRYAVIFTYKPQWDAGGIRWPFLSDMVISSLLASQVLLTTMMALKRAAGPAALACILSVPTIVFRQTCRKRFLEAFNDAALMQTSNLDGWDISEKSSIDDREAFRRFLVDSHKAAYVPACIAGSNTDRIITAEPAVVIPSPTDVDCGLVTPASDELPSVDQTTIPPASLRTASAPAALPEESAQVSSVVRQAVAEQRPSLLATKQAGAVMRRGSIAFAPVPFPGPQLRSGGSLTVAEQKQSAFPTTSSRITSDSILNPRLTRQGTRDKKEY